MTVLFPVQRLAPQVFVPYGEEDGEREPVFHADGSL